MEFTTAAPISFLSGDRGSREAGTTHTSSWPTISSKIDEHRERHPLATDSHVLHTLNNSPYDEFAFDEEQQGDESDEEKEDVLWQGISNQFSVTEHQVPSSSLAHQNNGVSTIAEDPSQYLAHQHDPEAQAPSGKAVKKRGRKKGPHDEEINLGENTEVSASPRKRSKKKKADGKPDEIVPSALGQNFFHSDFIIIVIISSLKTISDSSFVLLSQTFSLPRTNSWRAKQQNQRKKMWRRKKEVEEMGSSISVSMKVATSPTPRPAISDGTC